MTARQIVDEQFAAANLDGLLARTLSGEEFVVTRNGEPRALLLPPNAIHTDAVIVDRATIA